MTGMRINHVPNRGRLRRGSFGLLALACGVLAGLPAFADEGVVPKVPDGDSDAAVPTLPPVDRKQSETESRLESLQRQHKDLEFQKRTKQPFTSDRSLRHKLRKNERQQGWEKSEQRRLEYEQLKRSR